MKNIFKTKNNGVDRWCVKVVEKGKSKRRYFKNLNEAKFYLAQRKKAKENGLDFFMTLTADQILDVKLAFDALPNGLTLLDCVKGKANTNTKTPKIDLYRLVEEWADVKIRSGITEKYSNNVKSKVLALFNSVGSGENVNSKHVLNFVAGVSTSKKTQKNYFDAIREFYSFAESKGFLDNPFKSIHRSESPKVVKRRYKIPSVEDFKKFFAEFEKNAPEVVGLYVLVAFGGIRLAEAQRLINEDFDFNKKEILLAFDKTKTGDSWLQSKMPNNVWEWLKKYPRNDAWTDTHIYRYIQDFKPKSWEDNCFRHSFATYHLSKYRDAQKTSLLMRHRSPSMLWQNYLAGLVSEKDADEYFKILPVL